MIVYIDIYKIVKNFYTYGDVHACVGEYICKANLKSSCISKSNLPDSWMTG